jgi:hypothetical protein
MAQCPKCGSENRETSKFCVKCGAAMTQVAPASAQPVAQSAMPAAVPVMPQPVPVTGASPAVPQLSPAQGTAGPVTPMPGEPDMDQLLALLPDLEVKTIDLEIPIPDIDVNAMVEQLTRFNLDEQIKIIQQLEQQIKAKQNEPDKS